MSRSILQTQPAGAPSQLLGRQACLGMLCVAVAACGEQALKHAPSMCSANGLQCPKLPSVISDWLTSRP